MWPLYCEIVMKRLLSKWPLKARITDIVLCTIAGGHISYGLEHDLVLQKLVGLAFFCLVARGLTQPAVCWWK